MRFRLRCSVRTPAVLAADLAVAVACLLSGVLVQGRERIDLGDPSLTLTWGAVPVLAWAVRGGPAAGGLAAAVVCAATLVWRGDVTNTDGVRQDVRIDAVNGSVLLNLTDGQGTSGGS